MWDGFQPVIGIVFVTKLLRSVSVAKLAKSFVQPGETETLVDFRYEKSC